MTEEHIKEQLSNRYIGILAAHNGFQLDKGDLDYGVDFTAKRTQSYTMPGTGATRLLCDPKTLDIQLKATTENSVTTKPNGIAYQLEAKTYNDLVHRLGDFIPLILILFVLPSNRADWVDITATELRLRRLAYWWHPPAGSVKTNNTSRITINIPNTNILSIDCFNNLYAQFHP